MLVWFVYDIVEDRPRRKISEKAIELGLQRVQKSVFLGNVEETTADELLLYSDQMINEEEDSVYMFPMCQEDFKKIEILGQAFDKAMANNELKTLFL
ncbi:MULTISPECIES: CRISPR-associated endonuclease Cas2 [unclassified Candidatus Frackibacter]|uniref:CRISPR-associated endonuclease Cas2 n=1 Tax=unclassified Candidatus Frackibacter TaxID=2648818 RepID=UPI00088F263B|nr:MULTISPECIES: CRISPR-associated endonuclease Cas2 [unclassified Candidatus Frackibacter]SDC86174.1 CRISPR-associated protein, Cas2 family [Candidatus Frackibacter sp. WG11]SEN00484.1 CRISPR-associated protein, Cas2 family [Candidatus Frackibacter sp. WG12]SFL55725.1 CRISPR-associated protein, Cas2 family [Candidatus Frackibacter sp. WG13]